MNKLNKSLSEQYLQILDAIQDLVLVKGPNSRIVWANHAFCKYYGMTNEQLKNIIDSPVSEPDYTQQYIKDDSYVFNTGKVLEIPQEPVIRYDGVVRIFNTIKSPIFDDVGKVIMTVGVSRDVTDQALQEKLIQEQQAMIQTTAKMASLGEMAAEIAHEVTNPLAAIQMQAGLLKLKVEQGTLTPCTMLDILFQIESTISRIDRIIKGLRFFSRRGETDSFQFISFKTILNETISFCEDRLRHCGVELQLVDFADFNLECSPVQVSQVLVNLLNNALDATESTSPRWIRVEVFEKVDMFEVHMSDSGSGIPTHLRRRIFQHFFTTKPVGKGTGLGLSLSKSIVEKHHGTLRLLEDSTHTCFVIELPKRQPSAASKRNGLHHAI